MARVLVCNFARSLDGCAARPDRSVDAPRRQSGGETGVATTVQSTAVTYVRLVRTDGAA